MLVLTRKPGEAVLIDGAIQVRVVAIRGNQVRLGFAAPESVGILRDELNSESRRGTGPRSSRRAVDHEAGSGLAAAS
jgi:carbon storage regulator